MIYLILFLPLIVAIIFSISTFKKLRKSVQNQQEGSMTATIICLVIFIVLAFLTIFYVLNNLGDSNASRATFSMVLSFLITTAAAIFGYLASVNNHNNLNFQKIRKILIIVVTILMYSIFIVAPILLAVK